MAQIDVIVAGGSAAGNLEAVRETVRTESAIAALTGAGISVESGIPDFRSPGGLWERFDPMEYATLSCFLSDPERAWRLYRELGRTLSGRRPNPAHEALAALERDGRLAGIVTQNVDGLHQAAGSRNVIELHGEHGNLQCLGCGGLEPFRERHLGPGPVPRCASCGFALKPNVVLFEEPVRRLHEADSLMARTRLLLVAGTSAEVAPASLLPHRVLEAGGSLLVFDRVETRLARADLGPRGALILGAVGTTLPLVVRSP